jgi:hypothetical protein
MKTKYTTLLIAGFLLSSVVLSAQTVSGKLTDKTNVIPFANVTITNTLNKVIAGTTTDDNGLFELKVPKGNYKIEIRFLGYTTLKKEISVTKDLHLGTLLIEENAQALDEIVVKIEKRVIERKIDRLVFNVEKSIAAVGGNGLDILRITPGVQLQNGVLSILGKGATQVMINGRISPLQGVDLLGFLSGFTADDI